MPFSEGLFASTKRPFFVYFNAYFVQETGFDSKEGEVQRVAADRRSRERGRRGAARRGVGTVRQPAVRRHLSGRIANCVILQGAIRDRQ